MQLLAETGLVQPRVPDPMSVHLLVGCCLEAARCDIVLGLLDGLRAALGDAADHHLNSLLAEVKVASRLLRELTDFSHPLQDRVPLLLEPLNTVLPCLSRSLRDMEAYSNDRARTKASRWRNMYRNMTAEAGGHPLPMRFTAYNRYLSSMRDLLTRSPNFDLHRMDRFRHQVLQLREARGMLPPTLPVGPLVPCVPLYDVDPTSHWAEHIFSRPLPSRTALEQRRLSKSLGPHYPWGHGDVPMPCKALLRRIFNGDGISMTVYHGGRDNSPYLSLRILVNEKPWYSVRGTHELCIERDGCSLVLNQWSRPESRSKVWAVLCFATWEELVLVHCTFVSLKVRNCLTVRVKPGEYGLWGEETLFQGCIDDDGFKHRLVVYHDRATGGVRLHAAVWDEELRGCPVWTAFVTHQSASPTWLRRTSSHSVCLADVQLYVFCHKYRQQNQRRGPAGAFEIRFFSDQDARRFIRGF